MEEIIRTFNELNVITDELIEESTQDCIKEIMP